MKYVVALVYGVLMCVMTVHVYYGIHRLQVEVSFCLLSWQQDIHQALGLLCQLGVVVSG